MKSFAAVVIILICLAPSWFCTVFFDIGGRNRMGKLRILLLVPFRKMGVT